MSLDSLFDGSDAHEMCSACAGTGRVYEGERCKFCDGGDDIEPETNRHGLPGEIDELLEIAAWLDSLGKQGNAAFLRRFAARLEGGDTLSPAIGHKAGRKKVTA